MSQEERVINFLQIRDKEGASALDISRVLCISAPHSVIRDIRDNESLRKKHNIETITDEWRKTKTNGRYKQYFLKKMEG
jgi:hypothetical protein